MLVRSLHLLAGSNCGLDGYGTPVVSYTTDYDGETRNVTTPDIGADEFNVNYSGTLAGTAGSATCENKTVSVIGTTYATNACNLIASILPSGADPVTGKINTCVTLDASQQYFNAEPYVQGIMILIRYHLISLQHRLQLHYILQMLSSYFITLITPCGQNCQLLLVVPIQIPTGQM